MTISSAVVELKEDKDGTVLYNIFSLFHIQHTKPIYRLSLASPSFLHQLAYIRDLMSNVISGQCRFQRDLACIFVSKTMMM